MSEDNDDVGVRTATEECICAVLAESCYADGGTPAEFRKLMEKYPDMSIMYKKKPYIFKPRHGAAEEAYHESTNVYI